MAWRAAFQKSSPFMKSRSNWRRFCQRAWASLSSSQSKYSSLQKRRRLPNSHLGSNLPHENRFFRPNKRSTEKLKTVYKIPRNEAAEIWGNAIVPRCSDLKMHTSFMWLPTEGKQRSNTEQQKTSCLLQWFDRRAKGSRRWNNKEKVLFQRTASVCLGRWILQVHRTLEFPHFCSAGQYK